MRREEVYVLNCAMNESNEIQDFLDLNHTRDLSNHSNSESDEGCCVILDPMTSASPTTCVRRVKSTPNLLQIPSPSRNRKRSDDSALGSAEDSESDRNEGSGSSADNSPCDTRIPDRLRPFSSKFCPSGPYSPEEEDLPFVPNKRAVLLRPPSVVVSDHDLCQGQHEHFITLDDLDAEYGHQFHHRRRISDASTCSSFSELDFQIGGGDEDDQDQDQDNIGAEADGESATVSNKTNNAEHMAIVVSSSLRSTTDLPIHQYASSDDVFLVTVSRTLEKSTES